jgi:hypothetical protein
MVAKISVAVLVVFGLMVAPAAAEFMISAENVPGIHAEGEAVNVPLSLIWDDVFVSFDLKIKYDPAVLTLATAGLTKGPLLDGRDWPLAKNVNATAGYGLISMYATTPTTDADAIDHPNGVLLNALFHVRPGAPSGPTAIQLINLNEIDVTCVDGSINVVPEPSMFVSLITLLTAGPVVLLWRRRRAS